MSRRPRICIAHQTIMAGDAIGHDIAGQYALLERCGYEPALFCEHVHPDVERTHRVIRGTDPREALGFDMLIYHHSIYWPAGEELVERFARPVVAKYHNITPPEFFAPYSELYRETCEQGRALTARLARMPHILRWQCDSRFNAEEVGAMGVEASRRSVIPPFTQVDRVFSRGHAAPYRPEGPFYALFVGRRAPNKGHQNVLWTLAAWRDLFPEVELRCRVVGSIDPKLSAYYDELEARERDLGLGGGVEWYTHVDDLHLAQFFRSSHVYLNLSEHEGFCVPLIEAQAIGLPVVTTGAGAMADTAGAEQIVIPVPRSPSDYDMVAGLVHEVCVSARLRERLVASGARNVHGRFLPPHLEDRFIGDLEPVLASL